MIGRLTTRRSSSEGLLPSEIIFQRNLARSILRRRVDIISMSLTHAHGVRMPSPRSCLHAKLPSIAHRTLITRKLKGLEDIISFTSVHWHMQEKGAIKH
jgi:glutathionyl-hydroquinone reductase